MTQYRQGDILVHSIESLPESAKLQQGPCILAHGKTTGHNHQVLRGASRFLEGEDQYLEVTDQEAALVHDEHSTLLLPRGFYRVVRQRQYTPAAIINVED